MNADQRGNEHGGGGEQPQAGRNALRVEIVGEQQEETEHDDDHGVASRAHFHRFQGHEQEEQSDAGIPAEQGAELPANAGNAGGNEQRQQPAIGERRVALPQIGAPEQQEAAQYGEPERQVAGVRRGGGQRGGQQPREGALIERR